MRISSCSRRQPSTSYAKIGSSTPLTTGISSSCRRIGRARSTSTREPLKSNSTRKSGGAASCMARACSTTS